jgi:hypothetical protein
MNHVTDINLEDGEQGEKMRGRENKKKIEFLYTENTKIISIFEGKN